MTIHRRVVEADAIHLDYDVTHGEDERVQFKVVGLVRLQHVRVSHENVGAFELQGTHQDGLADSDGHIDDGLNERHWDNPRQILHEAKYRDRGIEECRRLFGRHGCSDPNAISGGDASSGERARGKSMRALANHEAY